MRVRPSPPVHVAIQKNLWYCTQYSCSTQHIRPLHKSIDARGRAVWQLAWLITRRSLVQIQPPQQEWSLMTLTTHAAAGIVVAYWTGDPMLGFFAAVISHFILDMIPHGDEFLYLRLIHNLQDPLGRRIAISDGSATIVLVLMTLLFKASPQNDLIIWGAVGGVLPDLLMTLYTHIQYAIFPTTDQGLRRSIAKNLFALIQPFQKFHGWCHDLIRTPIRLMQGYILQVIFLGWYAFFFLAK